MTEPARSPFSTNIPNFQLAQVVCGVLVQPKRLNRFVEWLEFNDGGCWLFHGPKTHNGYGSFRTFLKENG